MQSKQRLRAQDKTGEANRIDAHNKQRNDTNTEKEQEKAVYEHGVEQGGDERQQRKIKIPCAAAIGIIKSRNN